MKPYLPRSVQGSSFMATFKRSVAAHPEFISHGRQVKIQYYKLKHFTVKDFKDFTLPFPSCVIIPVLAQGALAGSVPAKPELLRWHKPYHSKEADAAPLQGQRHAAMSIQT